MNKTLLLAVGLCFALASRAQTTNTNSFYNITGKIFDENKSPVAYATIALLLQKDSSLAKGEVSDQGGAFDVEHIPQGNYLVAISSVGFQKYAATISLNHSLDLGNINLKKDAAELNEVVVQGTKPLIEHGLHFYSRFRGQELTARERLRGGTDGPVPPQSRLLSSQFPDHREQRHVE